MLDYPLYGNTRGKLFIFLAMFMFVHLVTYAKPQFRQAETRIRIGGGIDSVFDDEQACVGSLEILPGIEYGPLRPWFGVYLMHRDSYSSAGIRLDWHVTDRVIVSPGFGGGLVIGNTSLGSPVEFRSFIEIGYDFGQTGRLSLSLSHISNGGIGRRNPGTETISIQYGIPLNWPGKPR